jgi:hypothetical protein
MFAYCRAVEHIVELAFARTDGCASVRLKKHEKFSHFPTFIDSIFCGITVHENRKEPSRSKLAPNTASSRATSRIVAVRYRFMTRQE